MSVHDEIMTALCRVEMGEGWDESRFGWRHHADALLPIVERVAKYAAIAGINEGARSQAIDIDSIDAIVQSVMEGGQ